VSGLNKHMAAAKLLNRDIQDSMVLVQAKVLFAPDKQQIVLVKLDSLMCRLTFLLALSILLAFFLILQLR
jgi:hypothetical protein